MKKLLFGVVGLLVLVVVAVLVGPGLVDWNDYKDDIAAQARKVTGRDLSIGGDIRITLLPAPALLAHDVSLANLKGGSSPQMVQLKTVEVRVALGPLLGGQLKVETVRLIEPVIELEVLADGRRNWELQTLRNKPEAKAAAKTAAPSGDGPVAPASGLAVTLDNFSIVGGTLVYRDSRNGQSEIVENINVQVAAASLNGPLETTGSLKARGLDLDVSVHIGEIIHGRTVPLDLNVGIGGGAAKIRFNGSVVTLETAPRLKGKIRAEGANLKALAAAVGGGELPEALALPFLVEGSILASAEGIESQDMILRLDKTQASGDLSVDLGGRITAAANLGIKQVDLDAWLSKTATTPTQPKSGDGKAKQDNLSPSIPAPAAISPPPFTLPSDVDGSLILSVDVASYRGGVMRDLLVNAELANGAVNLTQVSGQFPGGSDLTASGKLVAAEGVPKFDGEVESTVNDLRGVLSWLGVKMPDIPADRMRKMSLATSVSATPKQVQVSGLDLRFDSSRLTGGVTLALRKRPSFGASLVIDRINVDSYLPATPAASKSKSRTSAKSQESSASNTKLGKASAPVFKGLAVLDTFDANLKLHAKRLVYQGTQIADAVFDGTLFGANLDLRRLTVGKMAGATSNVNGKFNKLAGVPELRAVKFETKVADIARLARMLKVELPIDARRIGAVVIKGRADGSALKPKLDLRVGAAGATVDFKGTVAVLPVGDMVNAQVRVRHGNLAKLVKTFGVSYTPSGRIGGIDLASRVKGGPDAVNLNGLKGNVGTITLKGDAAVSLKGKKPNVKAALVTGAIAVDPFLPAKKKASLWGPVRVIPAAWSLPSVSGDNGRPIVLAATSARWPKDPIDLGVLQSFDADLTLSAPIFAFDKYLVEKLDLSATVTNGVLSTRRLKGGFFGGALEASVTVAAGEPNRIETAGQLSGVDVAEATRSIRGKVMADGRLGANFDVTAAGRSVADLVSTLAGAGKIALTGVDVRNSAKGSPLAGALGLITSLNQLGGGKTGSKADVSGSFTISRGIARSQDFRLVSALGNGAAAGTIDLPGWTIDIAGQVELAQSFITQLLRAKVREARQAVPFSVKGPLDAPNIKLDTGALLGSSVPIPGADALLNKAPKGVGNLLKGLLGGGKSGQPQAEPSSPPPVDQPPPQQPPQQQQQQQQQIKPKDLLKQLFKL